jgi:Transglycosylase SLT domain
MRLSSACLVLLASLTSLAAQGQPLRPWAAAPEPSAEPGELCRAAVATAEREANLPPRLLAAIARVESGRRDPATGTVRSWPWAINAEGRGSFFPTKEAAIAGVRQLQAQGVQSIDVGCLQINLRHHPGAFANLEQAFDPLTNARYSARFLNELQATRGDWMRSASHYHSQTPDRAEAYRARLVVALAAEQAGPEVTTAVAALRPPAPPPPTPAAAPFAPGAGGGFMLSSRMERAPALPTPAGSGAGRGLDAYRMLPIPVVGPVANSVAGSLSTRGSYPAFSRRL